jgi:adenylate kinase
MILILGTPGAGKTTQTRLLAEYLNCPWFSMGELIRKEVKGKDRRDMLAGKIISDQVTLNIVDKVLSKIDTKNKECVFEGNPRSITQASWWLDQQTVGRFKINGVIHLVASESIAAVRLVQRGRLDDHDDNVVEQRFAEYHRSIKPTLDYLTKHNVPVHQVVGDGTREEVSSKIHAALGV